MKVLKLEIFSLLCCSVFFLLPFALGDKLNSINAFSGLLNFASLKSETIIGYFTIFVLLAQAVVSLGQKNIMKVQTQILARQENIAETQVLLVERLERPLVLALGPAFGKVGYAETIDKTKFPSVDIGFQNYGRSPALIERASVLLMSSKFPPERSIPESVGSKEFLYSYSHRKEKELLYYTNYYWNTASLAPGEVLERMDIDLRAILTTEDVDEIEQGNQRIWLDGILLYDDVFGKKHETHFRWVYDLNCDLFIRDSVKLYNRYT